MKTFVKSLLMTLMLFVTVVAKAQTPAACQLTLTVTNENKPYAVNVKVKTPTTDADGNALASLKKMEVYRDGALIFSVDDPYMGSSVRTDDENVPEGKHVYMAVAYGADGTRGVEVEKELTFGNATPEPATPAACTLTLTVTNETKPYAVNVKVRTPSVDTKGNALASLKKVEVYRDGAMIFSVDNPYMGSSVRTDDENVPEGKHVYMAVAYGADGTRGEEVSKEITFGNAEPDPGTGGNTDPEPQPTTLAVPFTHAFNSAASLDGFTIIDANNDGKKWAFDSSLGMAACGYNDFGSANDWLISPAVALEAGKTYTIEYMGSAYTNNGETVSISLGKGNTVAAMTTTVLPAAEYELPFGSAVPIKAEFTATETDNFNIGLHMTTSSMMFGGTMFLKSFAMAEKAGDEPVITPAACQLTLTVTNENKPYALNAKVKTPSVDTDGNALAGLKKVELLRDGVVIFSVDNPYLGSSVRTDDENVPEGKHVYTAYAYSLDGVRGEEVSKEIIFGTVAPEPDAAPQAVTNVVAVYDPETSKSTITWTAPTKGKNGVDLNGAVTYNIRRKGSYDLIASGLAETTFVDEVSLDNQALSAYYVTAVNEAGNSSEVKSNDLFIGKPYEIPFTETATNGVMQNTWQITRTGSSRWGASDLGNIAYDNDRGYITFCPLMENDGSTLTSGIINVADAANPSFRFHYFYVMPGDDRFDVSVKVDGGEPVKVWSYDYEDEDAVEQWMEVTLPLKEVLNGGKHVQLVFVAFAAHLQQVPVHPVRNAAQARLRIFQINVVQHAHGRRGDAVACCAARGRAGAEITAAQHQRARAGLHGLAHAAHILYRMLAVTVRRHDARAAVLMRAVPAQSRFQGRALPPVLFVRQHRAAHLRQRREYRRIRRPAAVVHYKHRAKARRQHLLRIGNELPARLVRRDHDTNTHAAQLPIERPLFRRAFISIYKTI